MAEEYDLPRSKEYTALHEAGHAVVAGILGYTVSSIEIYPGKKAGAGNWDGHTEFSGERYHPWLAAISLSGLAVHMRRAGQPMHFLQATYCAGYGGGGSEKDMQDARRHCRNAGTGYGLRWAWDFAKELTADADTQIDGAARKILAGKVTYPYPASEGQ